MQTLDAWLEDGVTRSIVGPITTVNFFVVDPREDKLPVLDMLNAHDGPIYLRLDDFPVGDYIQFRARGTLRRQLLDILTVLEELDVPYILAATPLLFGPNDHDFLNSIVNRGKVVMHGFWHGFHNQERVHQNDFAGMTHAEVIQTYNTAHQIMGTVRAYDPSQFVAPYNVYTQELLDVPNAVQSIGIIHASHINDQSISRTNRSLDFHGADVVSPLACSSVDFFVRAFDARGEKPMQETATVVKEVAYGSGSLPLLLHWYTDAIWVNDYVNWYRRLAVHVRAHNSKYAMQEA
jgi:hypothetical protein